MSRILLATYMEVKSNPDKYKLQEEIFGGLSNVEKNLSRSLLLVTIKGKRGRHAPCLIPRDCRVAIDILIEQRGRIGVPASNPYLFARPNVESCLDPWNSLNKFVKESDLEQPEFITSTKLRKYLGNYLTNF